MRKLWLLIGLIGLWLAFETTISWLAFCHPRNYQTVASQAYPEYCAFRGPFFGVLKWVGGSAVTLLHNRDKEIVAAFTIVLALSTIFLWISTREAARAARDAAKIANRSLNELQRAFIFIDGFDCRLNVLADTLDRTLPEALKGVDKELYVTHFAVQPKWKNGGNTPTKNLTVQVDCLGPNQTAPTDFSYRVSAEPFFIGPQAIERGEFIPITFANALIQDGVLGVTPMALIWGRAEYEDIFGNCHFTQWCYRIFFDRPSGQKLRAHFIQWGDYNYAE